MSLTGLSVIEFAGLAPGPFAGLILADNGASVTRVDKPSSVSTDILCRGKRSIAISPKIPSGQEALRRLITSADVLIDPFRPGVMERLGLGPEIFLGSGEQKGLNEKIIYARIVGFPRTGPHKDMAGHDINYLALSGALAMLPGPEKPNFPLNLLADFAGGGLICVLGILLALIERGKSGRGQVVNADMVSGARYVAAFPLMHALIPGSHLFGHNRGKNTLDGGAPFYNVYICKDGGWMSVGCLEPQFFKEFIHHFLTGLPKDFDPLNGWKPTPDMQQDRDKWPKLREFIEKGFMTNTRNYWGGIFHGTDACALPVLTPAEARDFEPSNQTFPMTHPSVSGSRRSKIHLEGSGDVILLPGKHTYEVLSEIKISAGEIRRLALDGALGEDERVQMFTRSHKL